MIRLVLFLVCVGALATGMAWLADRPGNLVLTWQGYEAETSVFHAIVMLVLLVAVLALAWSIFRQLWSSPAIVGRFLSRRRQERGLDALSSGMIAVGAGDRDQALRYALQARRSLPNEPLTHLLRAQAAQLSGDRRTARRIFEAMLASPDTEQLGLRGLFLEAERAGEPVAARQFAERAFVLNPRLGWPPDALFELQCMASDWTGALKTLDTARRYGHVERGVADRRRAVLLTAQAQTLEESNGDASLRLALEAHSLAPDLIPAAAIAGRLFASRGSTAKVARVIEKTWKRAPHPDLAIAYAHARPGDSPRDRLDRVKHLVRLAPHSIEGPIAVAMTAIDARDWATARGALAPLLETRLTQRVCTLMARIEGEERNDAGRVREWLARAVNAPRDPAWTADGVVSDTWAAISPVTGALDAFQWKVPVEPADKADQELAAAKLDELVDLGAGPMLEVKPVSPDGDLTSVHPSSDEALETAGGREPKSQDARMSSDTGNSGTEVVVEDRPSETTRTAPRATSTTAQATRTSPGSTAHSAAQPAQNPTVKRGDADRPTFAPPRPPDDPGPDESVDGLSFGYLSPAARRPL